jgi:hypothetical protein
MFFVRAFLTDYPLLVSYLLPIKLAGLLILESGVKILELHSIEF